MRRVPAIANPMLMRFALVGGLCFGVNIAILFACVEIAGLRYTSAMVFSIFLTYSLGWALNRRWTFRSKNQKLLAEYLRFFAANLGSMLVSMGAMVLLVSGLGMNYLLASAVIALAMMLANFVLHRAWTFASRG